MLEGIKMTYYSDLGINPADSGLSAMVLGMDNGQLHESYMVSINDLFSRLFILIWASLFKVCLI